MAVIEPLAPSERLTVFPHAVHVGDSSALWTIGATMQQSGHVLNQTYAIYIDNDDKVFLLFRTLDEALLFKLTWL